MGKQEAWKLYGNNNKKPEGQKKASVNGTAQYAGQED